MCRVQLCVLQASREAMAVAFVPVLSIIYMNNIGADRFGVCKRMQRLNLKERGLDLFNFKKIKAARRHGEGQKLHDEGRQSNAIAKYLEAIACQPKKSESY